MLIQEEDGIVVLVNNYVSIAMADNCAMVDVMVDINIDIKINVQVSVAMRKIQVHVSVKCGLEMCSSCMLIWFRNEWLNPLKSKTKVVFAM